MTTDTKRARVAGVLILGGVLALGVVVYVAGVRSCAAPSRPLLPPMSSSVSVLRDTPSVLLAVKDLARLESAVFHMERVIDLTDKQSHLFGLLETEDAILLVAVADVSGGVDLQKLTAEDVVADFDQKRVRITLPAPEVFHAALDNAKTYVHTRRTGTLAGRRENLETRARQEAERTLVDAARQAGLIERAGENARRVVEGLVRSLGYTDIEVHVKAEPRQPDAR
jgi:Protein of unknown function (DUF4230)